MSLTYRQIEFIKFILGTIAAFFIGLAILIGFAMAVVYFV